MSQLLVGCKLAITLFSSPGQSEAGYPLVVSATTFGSTSEQYSYREIKVEDLRTLISNRTVTGLFCVVESIDLGTQRINLTLLGKGNVGGMLKEDFDKVVAGPVLGNFLSSLENTPTLICLVNDLVTSMALRLDPNSLETLKKSSAV